jgi:hypothetical protein
MPQRSRRFGSGAAADYVLVSQGGYATWEAKIQAETLAATSGGQAVADGTTFVTVTSADANYIIILPDSPLGTVITLVNGATGYELRTSAPATIGINGGVGAGAESAIAANIITTVKRVSATNWVGASQTAAGVVGVTQVAAA